MREEGRRRGRRVESRAGSLLWRWSAAGSEYPRKLAEMSAANGVSRAQRTEGAAAGVYRGSSVC